ncbi:MAG: M23 family metallopeptidase [Anaerotignum sp.]|nr:M23 family metallopeptidase [Anaerotignum sp.]
MMKNDEMKTAKRVRTAAVCGCLCLLALGAGVTYRAFDSSHRVEAEQPVAAVKSPTMEIAVLERNERSNDPGEAPAAEPKETKQKVTKPTFAYPLQGEIVLPYSMDHAIYDPTLEQYHTNASISISAQKGTEVKAAADGTVTEVAEDAEMGRMVTISHGSNWVTAYGQLEDGVAVQKGDVVKQGQTIGTVAEPTKYGVALGSHLEFSMAQNGVPQDPLQHLKKAE